MHSVLKIKLKEKLLPLYEELYMEFGNEAFKKHLSPFYVQIGSEWKENYGLLFVGKATNGWGISSSAEELFADFTNESEDSLKWVEDQKGDDSEYNTSKSAFWRVTENIAHSYFPQNWYKYIAWSNLCKVAPTDKGNPSNSEFYKQKDICKKILLTEIDILKPKVVILFTSDWDILDLSSGKYISEEKWENTSLILYELNGVYYIHSAHPQGKIEEDHKNAIESLIKKIDNN